MTKHLTFLMIKRHLDSLFLEFKEGRSDKAAKLHSVTRLARQELAASKLVNVDNRFASFVVEIIGQKEVSPEDGYESILTRGHPHFFHGKFREDPAGRRV